MKALVVGATGATGRLLVAQLLERGVSVTAIVRSPANLLAESRRDPKLRVIEGCLLDLDPGELARHVQDCDAVASCLGHPMSLRGIFGPPRMLVTEATRRLCDAIRFHRPPRPVRFVLMNTAGNSNRDVPERVSYGQRIVIGLLRAFIPPHLDNERAADYLRLHASDGIGTHVGDGAGPAIEWAAVRPVNLIDREILADYDVHASPIFSAIFEPRVTSRIQVAHFMAELMVNDEIWCAWRGKMPVIYDRAAP